MAFWKSKKQCDMDQKFEFVESLFDYILTQGQLSDTFHPGKLDKFLNEYTLTCEMKEDLPGLKQYMNDINNERAVKLRESGDAHAQYTQALNQYKIDCESIEKQNYENTHDNYGTELNTTYVSTECPPPPQKKKVNQPPLLKAKEYARDYMKVKLNYDMPSGGAKKRAKPTAKKQTKWVSTGKKTVVAIKQGKKKVNVERVIYSNAKGDLRIRKITIMDDKTRQVKYIKF
jgi:hypothetical protein